MNNLLSLLICLLFCGSLFSQKTISNEIKALKSNGMTFQKTKLFEFETADIHRSGLELDGLKKGIIVSINEQSIQALLQEQSEFIQIAVPTSDRSEIAVTLKRHDIFADGFQLFASDDPDHSIDEGRYLIFGISKGGKYLVVSYTERGDRIRLIRVKAVAS